MSKTASPPDPRYPAEVGFVWAKAPGVEGLARLAASSLPHMPAWTVVVPDPSDPDTTPPAGATTTPKEL